MRGAKRTIRAAKGKRWTSIRINPNARIRKEDLFKIDAEHPASLAGIIFIMTGKTPMREQTHG